VLMNLVVLSSWAVWVNFIKPEPRRA